MINPTSDTLHRLSFDLVNTYLPYVVSSVAVVVVALLYHFFGKTSQKKPKSKYGVLCPDEHLNDVDDDGQANCTPIIRNFRSVDGLVGSFGDYKSIYEVFINSHRRFLHRNCFGSRKLIGVITEKKEVKGVEKSWHYYHLGPYSWETFEIIGKRVDNFSSGLIKLGLNSNENVAIYSETRSEWHIASFACFAQNIVVLTVYANLGLEPMIHAFNQGEISTLVTNGSLIKGLEEVLGKVLSLKRIIYTDTVSEHQKDIFLDHGIELYKFEEIEKLGSENPVPPNPTEDPSSLAVIMYTSGSTGMPKGVELSHLNVLSLLSSAFEIFKFEDDVHLSYLPLAHIFAFIVDVAVITLGLPIGFGNPRSLSSASVRNCKGDLEELRPTFFVGVPSVHDRIRNGIKAQIQQSNKIVRFLFHIAYEAKKKALMHGKDTPLFNRLIFNRFKNAIGGRVKFIFSGGAPLSSQCCEFISICFGVPFSQGYGLTETCGGSLLLELDAMDILAKSCGAPLPCCEVKLVDVKEMEYTHQDKPCPRGEIWIRGNSVSKGYYKNPTKTAEDFTVDGWFKTGDIGSLNPNGTFSIIDRKKNLVKPPHGEYIAPERLESIYRGCSMIDNIMVYACSKYNDLVALVVPNRKALTDWAAKHKLDLEWEILCNDERANKAVLDALRDVFVSAKLKSTEKILAVKLYAQEWTPENGWLTAAMKLRRYEIHKIHIETIEKLYEKLQE